ncbi:MAG TPA: MBL fold metallo-hydrolase [Candidatus Competibacteraceae bacterium]|nr:MBL fold metallo-hydrolase [Candidatus Competibacteraceae bacterium]
MAHTPAHTLDYPYGERLPAAGDALELLPGIHWLRMPLPFALDHINLWLLADGESWVAVDTGLGTPAVQELWQRLSAGVMAGRPLSRVLVTHYHPDHLGNAAWLAQRFAAPVLMSAGEFLTAHLMWQAAGPWDGSGLATLFRGHGLAEPALQAILGRGNVYRRGVPELPAGFRRLIDGDELDIGGRRWRVLVGYGHAPEHVSLYCAEAGVLISGDQVLPRISTNVSVWPSEPEGDPLGRYLDSLERLYALPAATLVLPSHGRPFRGLHARLEQLREHHQERLAALERECASPRCAAELLDVLFGRTLDTHQLFFAMGEAIAHLHYLQQRGRLQRQADGSGVWRFVR